MIDRFHRFAQYDSGFRKVAKDIYVLTNLCKMLNDNKSELWLLTSLGVAKFTAVSDFMKSIEESGVIEDVNKSKDEIMKQMAPIQNPIVNYEDAHKLLVELFNDTSYLCNMTVSYSSSGSPDIDSKTRNFYVVFDELSIKFPELKECLKGIQYCTNK